MSFGPDCNVSQMEDGCYLECWIGNPMIDIPLDDGSYKTFVYCLDEDGSSVVMAYEIVITGERVTGYYESPLDTVFMQT